ncbi:hypothetical protein Tco_1408588 [Tanacetum coccineum]
MEERDKDKVKSKSKSKKSKSRSTPSKSKVKVIFETEEILNGSWKRISEKRTKNQAKTDKTENGMEERDKGQSQSPKRQMTRVTPSKTNVKKVKSEAE